MRTKRVKTPLLVLGAENDVVIPSEMVQGAARKYGLEAKIFPDMAHNMMLETGWEEVAETIMSWLEERGL